MVSFNALGAGTAQSFIVKAAGGSGTTTGNTTSGTDGSRTGNTAGNAATQPGGGYSTNSTTGNNTAGTTPGSDGTAGTSASDPTTWSTDATKDKEKAAGSADALQDRFLTLLVAQMRNQDPLNPLENAEVTSQMAQISTVEGIAKMNTTMATISASTGMNRASASTGLIGQEVLVPGDKLSWGAEATSMRSGVTLDAMANQLTVELFNDRGEVVDQRTYTDQLAGPIHIDWTGRSADGRTYGPGEYTMRATVMSDAKATATTLATARVTGVVDSAEGVVALLADGKTVPISKINGVFQSRTGTTDKSQA